MTKLPKSPPAINAARRRIMRSIPSKDTEPERLLRGALRAAGLRGYRVGFGGAPGRPDVVFTRYKLAIFVHGCFWHRCPRCNLSLPRTHSAFWSRKFEVNQARDERNRQRLGLLGFEVLEFWECEVRSNAAVCVLRIRRAIAESQLGGSLEGLLVADRPLETRKGGYSRRRSRRLAPS